MKLAVIFVDFPDGRVNGVEQVFNNSQLSQIVPNNGNIDAVSELGIDSINGVMTLIPAKYTYYDRWNLLFSTGTYLGNQHPDYNSHSAVAYGSLKDYFTEVTNNHIQITPALTHSQFLGDSVRSYGIINRDTLLNGRRLIKSIMLPKRKYGTNSYFLSQNSTTNHDELANDAITELVYLHSIGEIEFDTAGFNGEIVIIFAGGSNAIGGEAHQKYLTARSMNLNFNNDLDHINNKQTRMDGLHILVHEIGHNPPFNFGHTNSGRYCVMNPNSSATHWDCPSHFNPIFKIQQGWVSPISYDKNQDVEELLPIETSKQCGIVTIYGKPSASSDFQTGEYYVLENRRKLGFDRKIDDNIFFAGDTANFKGGLLIWQFSPYNKIPGNNCPDVLLEKNFKLKLPNPALEDYNLCYNIASSEHFYGYKTMQMYHNLDSSRTYSSYNLRTGILISNINQLQTSNSGVSFSIDYSIKEPPNYSFVIYSKNDTNNIINLHDTVYYHEQQNKAVYSLEAGTVVESGKNSIGINGVKAHGSLAKRIIFQGAGFEDNRVSYTTLSISTNALTDSIIFSNCHIKNLSEPKLFSISSNQINIPIILNNNYIPDTSATLRLFGGENEQGSANLTVYDSNKINKIELSKFWKFNLRNDFIIDTNCTFFIKDKSALQTLTNINFVTPFNILCKGLFILNGDLNINRDINIKNTGKFKYFTSDNTQNLTLKFSDEYGLNCEGEIYCNGQGQIEPKTVTLDRIGNTGYWKGIICSSANNVYINNAIIKNTLSGITIGYTASDKVNIINSNFTDNKFADIKLDNMNQSDAPGNISDNTFTGTTTQLFNVGMNNVSAMNINNNTFSDVNTTGISLFYCSNPVVTNNNINATTSPTAAPYAGIHCYQSFGFFGCNSPTNFFNGVLLDNSSPYFLNNEIWNNGYGMYLTNNSNPILSPSYSQTQSLYNAGYNKIYNNLYEEVFCNNEESSQRSLPYLIKGFNTIYDDVNYGTLININYALNPALDAQSNYWGGTPDNGMFSPEGSVNYSDYLNDPETTNECLPVLANENNDNLPQSVLLFGSANINDYSGNYVQASNKYKQYIGTTNNASKKQVILAKLFNTYLKSNLSFGELNTYLVGAANQYTTDTAFNRYATFLSIGSNVEQTLYPQAINEFQSIIDNSQLPNEVYYANIEKLRSISLMLDTLLNTGGGDNPLSYSNGQISNIINNMLTTNYVKSNTSSIIKKSTINDATRTKDNGIKKTTKNDKGESINGNNVSKNDSYKLKQKNIDNIRGLLIPQNINTELLSNKELINLFEKVIEIKLFEQSLMNYTSANRPLNKIKPKYLIRKGNTFNDNLPTSYKLSQNYPNPFNPATKINFALPKQGFVTLKVYDIIGREIKTLVNEVKQAGYYTVDFNGSSLASGVYFYRIQSGDFVMTKRMILIK
ncbi:MAG: T9SS type A sorting domain-containing protein [Ignavibacteriae bacterium]|nr:T9SS type A sorting domain-containing protein [Ignavibacteriota bacterium]